MDRVYLAWVGSAIVLLALFALPKMLVWFGIGVAVGAWGPTLYKKVRKYLR